MVIHKSKWKFHISLDAFMSRDVRLDAYCIQIKRLQAYEGDFVFLQSLKFKLRVNELSVRTMRSKLKLPTTKKFNGILKNDRNISLSGLLKWRIFVRRKTNCRSGRKINSNFVNKRNDQRRKLLFHKSFSKWKFLYHFSISKRTPFTLKKTKRYNIMPAYPFLFFAFWQIKS